MKDKNGIEIKAGDILRYQETANDFEDYGKSIDEVVEIDGNLCGVQRVGFPRWTQLDGMDPIPLRYFASYLSDEVECVEIIGNVIDNPERMTPEYAHQIFPSDKANMNKEIILSAFEADMVKEYSPAYLLFLTRNEGGEFLLSPEGDLVHPNFEGTFFLKVKLEDDGEYSRYFSGDLEPPDKSEIRKEIPLIPLVEVPCRKAKTRDYLFGQTHPRLPIGGEPKAAALWSMIEELWETSPNPIATIQEIIPDAIENPDWRKYRQGRPIILDRTIKITPEAFFEVEAAIQSAITVEQTKKNAPLQLGGGVCVCDEEEGSISSRDHVRDDMKLYVSIHFNGVGYGNELTESGRKENRETEASIERVLKYAKQFGDLEKTDSGQPHVAEYRLAVNRLNRTIKPYAARGIKL